MSNDKPLLMPLKAPDADYFLQRMKDRRIKDERSKKTAVAALWAAAALRALLAAYTFWLLTEANRLQPRHPVSGTAWLTPGFVALDAVIFAICADAMAKGRYSFAMGGAIWMAIGMAVAVSEPPRNWGALAITAVMIVLIWRGGLAAARLGRPPPQAARADDHPDYSSSG